MEESPEFKTKHMILDFRRVKEVRTLYCWRSGKKDEVLQVPSPSTSPGAQTSLTRWGRHNKDCTVLPQEAASGPPPQQLLSNIYCSTIESLLNHCCTEEDRKNLKWVVKVAERVIRTALPCLMDIYTGRLHWRASNIIKDPSHPGHTTHTIFLQISTKLESIKL